MLHARLLKYDNARKLPLKKGGNTDLYINVRDARSSPDELRFLGNQYANALRRLGVKRIIEVPEAVSPLAGYVSAITDIPLVTIREEAKAGRVVSGKFIGEINPGDRVAIMDDVITDGASKFAALNEIKHVGAELAALVVLVDRQQGWKKKFAEAGFGDVPVWAGMTLHDVRKYLIENGLMQRCDPEVEAKNPLIVALDGQSWDDFLPYLEQLRTAGCIFKANDLLFNEGIKHLLPNLSVYGRVMADIKGHDIKNTLENICKHLRVCPPWAVTIHASGGKEMIEATIKALEGTPTIVLAVTVLTSIDPKTCEEIYTRLPIEQVLKLAEIAYHAGARGFVCSGEEAQVLRNKYFDVTIVVPGLRSPGTSKDEQKRTATFAGAKEAGANYLVGGRQFLKAADPVAEVKRVLSEELGIQ
jgi:orotidine-5'-phosphate decarboxylase